MIGFRKTTGSQDIVWPGKQQLLDNFNSPNSILSNLKVLLLQMVNTVAEDEAKRIKNPSKLTVGARALTKHAHRSSEGFWGSPKGTEIEKNEVANNIANLIVNECVWINVHILPH